MNISNFLKDKIISIIIGIVTLIFITTLLLVTQTNTYVAFFTILTLSLACIACLCFEYFRKRSFYQNLTQCMKTLDKSYLLSEMVDYPAFFEGEVLCDALKLSNKAMNDQIAVYKLAMEEYREYIEAWVHEVKTPISSSMLIIENNQNDVTKSLEEELNKIDAFVEQALFYSRSNTVEKDYIIKELNLQDIVTTAVRRNSKNLIENKIAVGIKELSHTVFTDGKWVDFIINQIISNSIKYKSEKSCIKFYAKDNINSISLFIEDNGAGIEEKDLPKVFDKGFTGENGRKFSNATGIGLYLCKKLCDKLGLVISISSFEGTIVEILFPKGKLHDLS